MSLSVNEHPVETSLFERLWIVNERPSAGIGISHYAAALSATMGVRSSNQIIMAILSPFVRRIYESGKLCETQSRRFSLSQDLYLLYVLRSIIHEIQRESEHTHKRTFLWHCFATLNSPSRLAIRYQDIPGLPTPP